MSQHLVEAYSLRKHEILRKISELDENIGENPEHTKKILASLYSELEQLRPFMEAVSPEIVNKKKKVTFFSASKITKEVYSDNRNMKAQEFLSILQKRQEYGTTEILKKKANREHRNNEKLEMMRRNIDRIKEKERIDKMKSHEDILIGFQRKEEERIRNSLDWRQFYSSYKRALPLFMVKEELFKENEDRYNEELNKIILEDRRDKARPLTDNLFKDHIKNFKQTRELSIKNNESRRIELIAATQSRSVSYYQSKFHEILKNEEQTAKSIENIKEINRQQYRNNQIEYIKHVKNDITIKTKMWEPELGASFTLINNSFDNGIPQISRRGRSISTLKSNSSPKKLPVETIQELNSLGNKNLDFVKSLKKKSPGNRESLTDRRKSYRDTGFISDSYYTKLRVNTGSNDDQEINSKTSKINYLPVIRDKLGLSTKKKNSEWIEVMNNADLNTMEKYEKVKINIKKMEEHASMVEKKIKYVDNDPEKLNQNKESLDSYYLNSIKAKIALLNSIKK